MNSICNYVMMRKQARPLFTHPPQSPGPGRAAINWKLYPPGDRNTLIEMHTTCRNNKVP